MNFDGYRPPRLLRNPHLQSVLASSSLRKALARRRHATLEREAEEHVLDCGGGVRLQGFLSRQRRLEQALGLVVLLHGWEGSVKSGYLLHTGGRLLQDGFDVFRLNFRDHGETHHLNEELFHSCRIEEVVGAVAEVAQRFPDQKLFLAGYSLGGNFSLRVALRAPAAGIGLCHVVAVCPVISPASGLAAIERAPWFYQRYFMQKWGLSLRRKQQLFPQRYAFTPAELRGSIRALTQALVERYTELGSVDAYLDGYSIAGERLAELAVPSSILTAADDPIIPIADFEAMTLSPQVRLDVAPFGGHCGFFSSLGLRSLAEDYVSARLQQAVAQSPG